MADLTGIILTKMDGTAKGGIAVAIQSELKVPVKYIGVGETIEDLQKFNSEEFVNALFDVNMEDIGELHLPEDEQQTDTRKNNKQADQRKCDRKAWEEKCRKKC